MKIPLDTAQRIVGTNGVSKILILLNHEDTVSFITKLRQYISTMNHHCLLNPGRKLYFYQQVEGMLSGIYFFIKLIVALIVVFMISNSLAMNIVERTQKSLH
jgi:putative ABC transport system permease protein